ncbi:hypothetical protein UCRNP2_8333 [Neofusicoccum parvum UCRNP2]|uniref:Uncharacterized protein n=1 Tax=Botryosphaeria parva (strain UCR-NP2) TaxID=1287680 RepID=R1GGC8_BOTPV|nr:hypothetical protein UCRNP2_8333 [Neofusicoccum parvum UCRNP2]
MKASTAIPLTIAGAIWALTASYIAFIVYRIIRLPLDDEPACIRTRARSRRSHFPHHWRRTCTPDIELQPLPRLNPRDDDDAAADDDALTCWPRPNSSSPVTPTDSSPDRPAAVTNAPRRLVTSPAAPPAEFAAYRAARARILEDRRACVLLAAPTAAAEAACVELREEVVRGLCGGWPGRVAAAALCPSGWRLAAVMNKPPTDSSGFYLPVSIDSGDGEGVPVVRHFIQFSQLPHTVDLFDMLFVEESKDLFPGRRLLLEHMMVRKEVHTYRRLPRSDAAVVAVRTTIKPLVDLEREEMEALVQDVESWPHRIADERGKFLWEGLVMEFCGIRLGWIT